MYYPHLIMTMMICFFHQQVNEDGYFADEYEVEQSIVS